MRSGMVKKELCCVFGNDIRNLGIYKEFLKRNVITLR